jgi:hypothetical protein
MLMPMIAATKIAISSPMTFGSVLAVDDSDAVDAAAEAAACHIEKVDAIRMVIKPTRASG